MTPPRGSGLTAVRRLAHQVYYAGDKRHQSRGADSEIYRFLGGVQVIMRTLAITIGTSVVLFTSPHGVSAQDEESARTLVDGLAGFCGTELLSA